MFETAGVARTERSIINWCHPDRHGVSRLDCFYDANERKYFITPQSVELAIKEELAKAKVESVPNVSEAPSHIPKVSEKPNAQNPAYPQTESSDFEKVLRAKVRRLTLQTEVDKRYIEKLEIEHQRFFDQMLQQSRQIGILETELKQIEAPKHRHVQAGAVDMQSRAEDHVTTEDDPRVLNHEIQRAPMRAHGVPIHEIRDETMEERV